MVVTDAAHEVRWDAGVGASDRPSLHAERSVQRGRIHEFSREKQWGADLASGESGTVVDYTFRAGEGQAIIRDAARPLGWTEGRGLEQRIIGIIAGVLVVTGQ